jgi:ribosome-associated protein
MVLLQPAYWSIALRALEFTLQTDYIELNQLLKLSGLCESGGAGKALVAAGQVSVDGKPELRKAAKIRAGQVVCCGDARISISGPALPPPG